MGQEQRGVAWGRARCARYYRLPDDAARMESNPYEAPAARVDDPVVAGVEAERRAHLRHEARLRSVGVLYWLGAAAMLVLVVVLASSPAADPGAIQSVTFALATLLAAFVGWGFWSLSPWVRWPGTVLSVVGLAAIPIGPIVNGYVLYLMWCAKGRRVLSPAYAQVRRETPHLRYRRTVGDWIALAVIVAVPLAMLALAWIATMLPKDY